MTIGALDWENSELNSICLRFGWLGLQAGRTHALCCMQCVEFGLAVTVLAMLP